MLVKGAPAVYGLRWPRLTIYDDLWMNKRWKSNNWRHIAHRLNPQWQPGLMRTLQNTKWFMGINTSEGHCNTAGQSITHAEKIKAWFILSSCCKECCTVETVAMHILVNFSFPVCFGIPKIYCIIRKSSFESVMKFWSHDDINWKHFPRYWPFVREATGHRWISLTKSSDAELWCFLWSALEHMVGETVTTPVIGDATALIMASL